MDGTVRVRSVVSVAAAVVLAVACTLLATQAWSVGAAPGDEDSTFVPVAPCRLFDFRPGEEPLSGRKTPLAAGETSVHTQQVTGAVGNCAVPSSAVGVSMNVTIANPTERSNLRVFPANVPTPKASNLNWLAGQAPTPNKVDVKLSPDGKLKLFNEAGTVNVIADVVGYYSSTTLQELAVGLSAANAKIAALEAPRSETVTFSGLDMQSAGTEGGNLIGPRNNCTGMLDSRIGFLTLPIPEGASITSVTADIFAIDGYEVRLERRTNTAIGELDLVIASASGGSELANVEADLTPTGEVVDAGERFAIWFDDQVVALGSGLCAVTVSYLLPNN